MRLVLTDTAVGHRRRPASSPTSSTPIPRPTSSHCASPSSSPSPSAASALARCGAVGDRRVARRPRRLDGRRRPGSRATVPLTLAPSPATVAALDRRPPGPGPAGAVARCVSLAAEPGRQTLCGPFVPVDASALVTPPGTGRRARRTGPPRAPRCSTPSRACASPAARPRTPGWRTRPSTRPPSPPSAALGYHDVVVPPSAVAGPTLATTPTRRFTLVGRDTSDNAVLSDPSLSARLQPSAAHRPGPGRRPAPGRARARLLRGAEHARRREAWWPCPRRLAAPTPPSWPTCSTGCRTTRWSNPVTLATLFSEVPGGRDGGTLHPAVQPPSGGREQRHGTAGQAIAAARLQWTGFSAAVCRQRRPAPPWPPPSTTCCSRPRSQQLTPAQQRAGRGRASRRRPTTQLALLSVTSREVRLTASTGSVPITRHQDRRLPGEGRPHRHQ